jgi:3-isopropylmalate/(R)-2-methylmalate dehydratase small subunit
LAEPIIRLEGVAAPLLEDNIDTDIIIPSREMRSTGKTGLADGLFANRRYRAGTREPDPDFILNQPDYRHARILLAGGNFGCGSSREHAAWALAEWGIRAVVAPSFNPIFFGNAVRNGIVPVALDRALIAELGLRVTIDLQSMTIDGQPFVLPADARTMLMEGLDPIDLSLKHEVAIAAWTRADQRARPWAWLRPD